MRTSFLTLAGRRRRTAGLSRKTSLHRVRAEVKYLHRPAKQSWWRDLYSLFF